MAYDIFISYRRKGGYETAKHLFDLLSRDGYKVSFDIDTLRNGDFDVELLKRVEECTDFVLILNEGAFDRTVDPYFDPQKDWLRQELAHALKLGKNIIPIMLNGFTEFPDNLPADVARVQKKNGPKYDQYYFDGFYNKLVDVFLETPKPIKPTAQATTSKPTMGTLRIDTDLDCRIFNYGKEVGIAKAGAYTTFELPLGDNDLEYIGLESNDDCYGEMVTVLENHQKLVRVKLLNKYNARKEKEKAERKVREEAARKAEQERKIKEEEERKAKRVKQILSWSDDGINYGLFGLGYLGELATLLNVDKVHPFREGLARFELNGKYSFIDKNGNAITCMKYNRAQDFSEGLAPVQEKDGGLWYFIDKTGRDLLFPLGLWNEAYSFSGGLAIVRDCTQIGHKYNNKWGCIDKTGKRVIPCKYDRISPFSEGLACVELNGKYGYIDKTGKEVIPLKYDFAWSFENGRAHVTAKNIFGIKKRFYIDKNGNKIK